MALLCATLPGVRRFRLVCRPELAKRKLRLFTEERCSRESGRGANSGVFIRKASAGIFSRGCSIIRSRPPGSPIPTMSKTRATNRLAPEKWKSYGKIYRVTIPGHLSAVAKWTDGPTKFEFSFDNGRMVIEQDGDRIAGTELPEEWRASLGDLNITAGEGLYGPFRGKSIEISE